MALVLPGEMVALPHVGPPAAGAPLENSAKRRRISRSHHPPNNHPSERESFEPLPIDEFKPHIDLRRVCIKTVPNHFRHGLHRLRLRLPFNKVRLTSTV